MTVRAWWEGPPRDLAVAVTTALAAGLLAATWLRLPTDLWSPPNQNAGMILAEDPGRAEWRAVIAELGGLGATFVIPAAFYGPPPAAYPVYESGVDRDMDQLAGEIDAQMRETEWRHVRWSQDDSWRRHQEMLAAEAQAERQRRDEAAYGYEPASPTSRQYTSYRDDQPPPDEFEDDAAPMVVSAGW